MSTDRSAAIRWLPSVGARRSPRFLTQTSKIMGAPQRQSGLLSQSSEPTNTDAHIQSSPTVQENEEGPARSIFRISTSHPSSYTESLRCLYDDGVPITPPNVLKQRTKNQPGVPDSNQNFELYTDSVLSPSFPSSSPELPQPTVNTITLRSHMLPRLRVASSDSNSVSPTSQPSFSETPCDIVPIGKPKAIIRKRLSRGERKRSQDSISIPVHTSNCRKHSATARRSLKSSDGVGSVISFQSLDGRDLDEPVDCAEKEDTARRRSVDSDAGPGENHCPMCHELSLSSDPCGCSSSDLTIQRDGPILLKFEDAATSVPAGIPSPLLSKTCAGHSFGPPSDVSVQRDTAETTSVEDAANNQRISRDVSIDRIPLHNDCRITTQNVKNGSIKENGCPVATPASPQNVPVSVADAPPLTQATNLHNIVAQSRLAIDQEPHETPLLSTDQQSTCESSSYQAPLHDWESHTILPSHNDISCDSGVDISIHRVEANPVTKETPVENHTERQEEDITGAAALEQEVSTNGSAIVEPIQEAIELSTFHDIPKDFPRETPVVVMGDWTHGQLVWWNRFLANRKRSQGTLVGNYLGRVIDLESEWFPGRDLSSTRGHLKTVAAGMGRRTLVVQSLSEMRYMTIPPRSIVATFSSSPAQESLLQGLRQCGSLPALRGLRRAEMIQDIRNACDGRPNSLLEVEFLALCLDVADDGAGGQQCSVEELEYLQSVSVWDVLKSRDLRGPGATARMTSKVRHAVLPNSTWSDAASPKLIGVDRPKRRRYTSPTVEHPKAGRRKWDDPISGRKGGLQQVALTEEEQFMSSADDEEEVGALAASDADLDVEEAPQRRRRRRRQSRYNDSDHPYRATRAAAGGVASRRRSTSRGDGLRYSCPDGPAPHDITLPYSSTNPAAVIPADIYSTVRDLIQSLCLRLSDLVFLLRGVPLVLLASPTGIPLPEELPAYTMNILQQVIAFSVVNSDDPPCLPGGRAGALHLFIANTFLHKLFRTIAVRVCVQEPDSNPGIRQDGSASCVRVAPSASATENNAPQHLTPAPSALPSSSSSSSSSKTAESELLSHDAQRPNVVTSVTAQTDFPSDVLSPTKLFSIVFTLDHTHQSLRNAAPRSPATKKTAELRPAQPSLYTLRTPFPCAIAPYAPWCKDFASRGSVGAAPTVSSLTGMTPLASVHHDNASSCHDSTTQADAALFSTATSQPTLHEMCRRTSLRLLGVGPGSEVRTDPGPTAVGLTKTDDAHRPRCVAAPKKSSLSRLFRLKLGMISDAPPDSAELETAAHFVVERRSSRLTVQNLKKRVETLHGLREIAAHIQSVYEDQVKQQAQAKDCQLSTEDWKYFEALWADLHRKLKG